MKKLIFNEEGKLNISKLLYYSIVVFLFLYAFSIPSFSARDRVYIITYAAMSILGVLTFVYYFFIKKGKIEFKKWQFYFIPLFVVFSIISTAIYSKEYAEWKALPVLAVSFFVLYFAFKSVNNRNLSLLIVVLAIFAFSIYYLVHYMPDILNYKNYSQSDEGFRLGSYFDNENAISANCSIGLSACLYLLFFEKKKAKYTLIIPTLSIFATALTTGSRAFIVGVLTVLLVLLFFKFKKKKIVFFGAVGILIIAVFVFINLPFAATIKARFIRVFNTLFDEHASRIDTSSIERITWFKYGFYLGFKNIFIGYGMKGFAVYSGVGTYVHSNLSEVICDFGIIGLFIFYAPLFILLFYSIKNKKRNSPYVVTMVIYYLVISFVNVFFYIKFFYFNLAFLYYLAFEEVDPKISLNNIKEKVNKILITCDGMDGGGAERVISILSNELISLGFETNIIGVSSSSKESFYHLKGAEYHTLRSDNQSRINTFKRLVLLRRYIKRIKPDLIISFLPHVNVYTYFATIGLNIPLIVSERNNPYVDPKETILRLLKKYVFIHCSGCVFQTYDAMNFYPNYVSKKSTIIHNPVMNSGVVSEEKENKIISVGRLEPQKNYPCLIKAFSLFNKKHPQYSLRLYGEGSEKGTIESTIKSFGLQNSVKLIGNSLDWMEKEKNACAFVLSSNYEGMPNSLMEAISLGIPCVATNCPIGGPGELVVNGVNGFLANVNDPEDISNKLEKAISLSINKAVVESFNNQHSANFITNRWLNFAKCIIERELNE